MFSDCYELKTLPSGFGINARVIECSAMFQNCRKLKDLPSTFTINGLYNHVVIDTNNSFSSIFRNCESLSGIPSNFHVGVVNPTQMFFGCKSLTSLPDTAVIELMYHMSFFNMFANCSSLSAIPACFSNSSYKDNVMEDNMSFYGMFANCSSLVTIPENLNQGLMKLPDGADFTTSGNYSYMFYNCKSLSAIPDSFWPVFSYSDMPELEGVVLSSEYSDIRGNFDAMFYGCENLQNVPSINLNGSNAITFANCYNLKEFPVNWTLPGFELLNKIGSPESLSLSGMFANCNSLSSDITNIFSSIIYYGNLIGQMSASASINLGSIFYNCENLKGIATPEHLWNANLNYNLYSTTEDAFYNCSDLTNYTDIPVGWK